MSREELQHVVEEADASGDSVSALSVDVETQRDLRLGSIPFDDTDALRSCMRRNADFLYEIAHACPLPSAGVQPISSSESRSAAIPLVTWSSMPTVRRT